MEALRRGRAPVRATVTKLCNELEMELLNDPPNPRQLKNLLGRLEMNGNKLMGIDSSVMEYMTSPPSDKEIFDDDQIQVEYDACEAYSARIVHCQNEVEHLVKPIPKMLDGQSTLNKTYKLPKIEVQKFKGEIIDWLGWWAQFSKIHEDDKVHDSDKFQYLSQAMVEGTIAATLVKSYPQTAENYPKVIAALKERFGKERLLKRVYVRELLKITVKNSREGSRISETYDKLEAHIKALESLGITSEMVDVLLLPLVESCLPEEIITAWQRSNNYGKDDPNAVPPKKEFDFLMEFLRREVENEVQREMAQHGFNEKENAVTTVKKFGTGNKNKKTEIPTAASLHVTTNEGNCCIFCDKPGHRSEDCFKARSMNLEQRQEKIKESGSCFQCLKKGHSSKRCKQNVKCFICDGRHLTIMCRKTKKGEEKASSSSAHTRKGSEKKKEEPEDFSKPDDSSPTSSNSNQIAKRNLVLLKTLRVRVRGANGKEEEVRLLFDDGSQQSYVATSLAQKLQCEEVEKLTIQNTLFGGTVTKPRIKSKFNVIMRGLQQADNIQVKLMNEDILCGSCPVVPSGPWLKELEERRIKILDTWTDSAQIQILIGSDLWGSLMTGRTYKTSGGLFAMETVLGWTLSGELPISSHVSCNYANTVLTLSVCDDNLSKLWSLDALGIQDEAEKVSQEELDEEVKTSVKENISREQDGRYVVKLPWVDKIVFPPSNRAICEKRLHSTTARLVSKNELENYDQIFKDWEDEGIIEKSTTLDNEHFLPHHPVFKPESSTTPVRPVFDGSCKNGKFPSLNQCLEKGPNLLELIPSILLRFRRKKKASVADIRKAFQMIGVAEEDRGFQKFLWWEDPKTRKKLIQFQHARVVFGMNCSPFILAAVIEHHLDNVALEDKPSADELKHSLYVDNLVASFHNENEYETFYEKYI